jgi:hypothetical protein
MKSLSRHPRIGVPSMSGPISTDCKVKKTMAKSLEKARKQIAKKKKSGVVAALHQRSRDSQRLHRARTRDERLEKLLDSRKRKEQPLCE